jgi:selenocysteine-specific elongation factor
MAAPQINITIGTAGHIDHGKTVLIQNITGCDTDRLKAEKERGMSIELGFAPCVLGDMEVGIVDVPGHENFVKTMVAGASGMDGAILVVAADDGVMPQTREHLDILTLLGVRHGVVAMTKIDRVEPAVREAVQGRIRAYLAGTFLHDAPICPVSNMTGEGIGAFLDALGAMVQAITPKRGDGVFRLPVERAFSPKGYGTVISGIPVSGSARTGDAVVLLPQHQAGRIKAIQVYGRDSETCVAGQCAAINVRHWDHREIDRGCSVASPGYFEPLEWCVCTLRVLPLERVGLKNGVKLRLHIGTSEVSAAVYFFDDEPLQAGEEGFVQLHAERPIVVGPGDGFILRSLSPVRTVGGGMVLEAAARRVKRRRPGLIDALAARATALRDERSFIEHCLRTADAHATSVEALSRAAKVPCERLAAILDEMVGGGTAVRVSGELFAHAETAATCREQVLDAVRRFHGEAPESPGMLLDDLVEAVELPEGAVRAFAALLVGEGTLVDANQRLALAAHRAAFSDADRERLETVESLFREAPFRPPSDEELAGHLRVGPVEVQRLRGLLLEHGRLVRVAEGLFFHRDAVERARERLVKHIREHGRLESVEFKYLLETTRKFAIPLLDYFDRVGVTRRVGNTRYLGVSHRSAR